MQTFGLTLMLRNDPAKIESYKDYHQRVWPEVTARLREVGVREMRIFLRGTRMFMYIETDDDFEPRRDFVRVNEDPKSAEWNQLMADLQERAPEADPAPSVGSFWDAYAERNQLFAGDGPGRFRDISPAHPALCGPRNVARALAAGDFDGDGALDLLLTCVGGRARLLRNVTPGRGHGLLVRATDPRRKRDAYGAEVTVEAGGRRAVFPLSVPGWFAPQSRDQWLLRCWKRASRAAPCRVSGATHSAAVDPAPGEISCRNSALAMSAIATPTHTYFIASPAMALRAGRSPGRLAAGFPSAARDDHMLRRSAAIGIRGARAQTSPPGQHMPADTIRQAAA